MSPNRYTVITPHGDMITVKAMSSMNAVAYMSGKPRHNVIGVDADTGYTTIQAREGNGNKVSVWKVSQPLL